MDLLRTLEEENKQLIGKIDQMRLQKKHLTSQLNENELSLNEVNLLEDDAVMYHMVGPVATKCTTQEAKTNLDRRIALIKTQISSIDTQGEKLLTTMESNEEKMRQIYKDLTQKAVPVK